MQHPRAHGLFEPLELTHALLSLRKLLGDALIDRLSHENLSRTGSTLKAGGKIHDGTDSSKIAARLTHVTDCSLPGVDANTDTDGQLPLASLDRAERGGAQGQEYPRGADRPALRAGDPQHRQRHQRLVAVRRQHARADLRGVLPDGRRLDRQERAAFRREI